MILLDLIYNLAVLVALSVFSAFLDDRFDRERPSGKVLQGLLFGAIAVVGMLYPLVVIPGLIFDGRTVVISLCSLFYGPLAGGIAALIAAGYRLTLGGAGLYMGIATVATAWGIGGVFFRRRRDRTHRPFTKRNLYLLGLLVHFGMLACAFLLPRGLWESTLRSVGPTVIIAYPFVTVLIGKILLDEMERKVSSERTARDLEEKKVLLREVHHRVKNNMQVIISLFHLRMEKIRDDEARREFRDLENRIHTMARAQELLYQSDEFSRLDLKRFLGEVVDHLINGSGEIASRIGVDSEIDEVRVDVDRAVIIGQVVTELLCNTLKYAFPGGRSGKVRISVKDHSDGIVLEFEDDGIGLPPEASLEELADTGLRIVFGHVHRRKKGTISYTSDSGLRYRIVFPAEPAPSGGK